MTEELIQVALPAGEQVAEGTAGSDAAVAVVLAADPLATADAADFAGMVADDPEATQRYLDSLLVVLDLVEDAQRLMEVLPLW